MKSGTLALVIEGPRKDSKCVVMGVADGEADIILEGWDEPITVPADSINPAPFKKTPLSSDAELHKAWSNHKLAYQFELVPSDDFELTGDDNLSFGLPEDAARLEDEAVIDQIKEIADFEKKSAEAAKDIVVDAAPVNFEKPKSKRASKKKSTKKKK